MYVDVLTRQQVAIQRARTLLKRIPMWDLDPAFRATIAAALRELNGGLQCATAQDVHARGPRDADDLL